MSTERKFAVGDIGYIWGYHTCKIYKCKVIQVDPPYSKTMLPYTVECLSVVDIDGNIIEADSGEVTCREYDIWLTAKEAYYSESAVENRQCHEKWDMYAKEINNISDLLKFPFKHNLTDTNRDDIAYGVYKTKANELFGIKIL